MRGMNTSKPIQIFKPGKHTAMSGQSFAFSESDLAATVAAYDPAKYEAPLTIGHPKHDKPRFGGVGALSYSEGFMDAQPKDVLPEFAEWVGKKMFTSVSASFYAPDAPNNPVPGVYYLRHVGFLGAQPPAVKGLNQHGLSFSADEQGVIEFSDGYDDMNVAKLFRNIREFFIGKFSQDEADRVLPDYQISSLEAAAAEEIVEDRKEITNALPAFAEPQPKGGEMSAEEKAQLAALQAENATLKSNQVAFAEADKKRKTDARHAEHVSFAEGLVKEGKLLPANKDVTVATMDFMAAQDSAIEFGEGDAKKPLLDAYKASLLANPKLIEFGEVAGAVQAGATAAFKSPDGLAVDADRLVLHNKAVEFAEANNVTYEVALSKVSA